MTTATNHPQSFALYGTPIDMARVPARPGEDVRYVGTNALGTVTITRTSLDGLTPDSPVAIDLANNPWVGRLTSPAGRQLARQYCPDLSAAARAMRNAYAKQH